MAKTKEKEPGYIYFKFYFNDWLTSTTVRSMKASDKGIYIDLLAYIGRDSFIPENVGALSKLTGYDQRTLRKWLDAYGMCLVPVPNASSKLTNAKVWNLLVEMGKLRAPKITDADADIDAEEDRDFFNSAANSAADEKARTTPAASKTPLASGKPKALPQGVKLPQDVDLLTEWMDTDTGRNWTEEEAKLAGDRRLVGRPMSIYRPKITNPDCEWCSGRGFEHSTANHVLRYHPCGLCFPDGGTPDGLVAWRKLLAEKYPDMPQFLYVYEDQPEAGQ